MPLKALADGTIQTVPTDHCSFTTEQKALGKDDFTKIPEVGAPELRQGVHCSTPMAWTQEELQKEK